MEFIIRFYFLLTKVYNNITNIDVFTYKVLYVDSRVIIGLSILRYNIKLFIINNYYLNLLLNLLYI